jgi:hypothetical protein
MKRSTVFLLIALTTPLLTSIAVISAGMQKINPVEGASGSFENLFDQLDGNMEVIHEALVPVSNQLTLTADAAQVDVHFDPTLQGQARVKVESKTPQLATISIGERSMSFAPAEKGQPLRVTISLPVNFESLHAEFNAVRCEMRSDSPVRIDGLKLNIQASKCDFDWQDLTTHKLFAELNAGNLDFRARSLTGSEFKWDINAANLDLRLEELRFSDQGLRQFSVTSATGNGEIRIEKSPSSSLSAELTMGKLEVDWAGERVDLSGMNQEHRINGPTGSPGYLLEVNMGKLQFDIDQFTD